MPKLNVRLSIGFPSATHKDTIEIDDGEWNDCETDEERQALIDEYANEWAWNYVDISADIE